jgi:hypothetical protein
MISQPSLLKHLNYFFNILKELSLATGMLNVVICHPNDLLVKGVEFCPLPLGQIRLYGDIAPAESGNVFREHAGTNEVKVPPINPSSEFAAFAQKVPLSLLFGLNSHLLSVSGVEPHVVEKSSGGGNQTADNAAAEKAEPEWADIKAWHVAVGVLLAMLGGFCGFLIVLSIINVSRWLSEKPYSNGGNTSGLVLGLIRYGDSKRLLLFFALPKVHRQNMHRLAQCKKALGKLIRHRILGAL